MSVQLQVTQSSGLKAIRMQGWLAVLLLAGSILGTEGLARSDFFPFAASAGDASIFRNDDDNTLKLCSTVPYTFLGRQRSCFYINNNGIITFTGFLARYSSDSFPISTDFQTIAPFYGDVDTRGSGQLWYRETTSDSNLMNMVDDTIHQAFADEGAFTSRSITVVTWDEVGYFDEMSDLVNTFQCVMASDGQNLFVIFLYANIEWTNNSAEVPPAQVGFNAGDGVHHYVLPGSQTEAVANIISNSNMGVPGKWVYKVSGPTIQSGGCPVPTVSSGTSLVPTCITSSYGNQLGGDLITIQGPYFSDLANIQCDFDGITRVALHESGSRVHCAVPLLPRTGRIPLQLLINGRVKGEATYTALNMETAHRVDVTPSPSSTSSLPLALTGDTTATLTWNPQHIFPQVNPELEPFNVDVLLYTFNVDSAQWEEHSILADNIGNDGSEVVTIPSGVTSDVLPIAIQVATSLNPSTRFDREGLYRELFRSQQRVGIWSSEYYYINPDVAGMGGRELCQDWNQQEGTGVPTSLVSGSTPCAPTLAQARLASSGLSEIMLRSVYGNSLFSEQWTSTFHSGSTRCFRQATLDSTSQTEQECCYDNSGNLISGSPNGGTIKRVSKKLSRAQHFMEDIRPFLLCCAGLAPNCALYYAQRPSDNGSRFNPPTPAWMFGDPHMITLDHTSYTFNGHGEFTLLTTPDSSFTLQGRMVPLPDTPQGTVFTAIAARVGMAGTRVMVGASANTIEIFVNDSQLDGREFAQERVVFGDFSISLKNRTASLQFVNGVSLECQVSTQGFMTRVVVGVPKTFVNRTRGLLGVFNGIPEDDLTPAGSNAVPVPVDSDLRTIHQQFGMTWMVEDESNSLFTYLPYTTLSSFSDSSYQPLFDHEPTQNVLVGCEGDPFCAFDTTVTGSMSFGKATLSVVREEGGVVELAAPVTCDPPCSNGACIPGNQCSCPQGFSGPRCQTPEMEDCGIINPCDQSERCFIQAGSYQCVLDCINNPSSELCNPNTVPPLTNTITIIIAAVSVVGGTLLIIFLVIIILLLCVVCRKRRGSGKEHASSTGAEGHYHSKTVVGSKVASMPVSRDVQSLNGDRKTSTSALLPSYSDLEMNEKVNRRSRRASEDGILSRAIVSEEEDYENLGYLQPHVRRTSLGAIGEGQVVGAGHREHTVISISPDSEDGGSPREGNPTTTTAAAKTSTNGRQQFSTLAPIQDELEAPWYQSTQSMRSQGYSTPTSPLTPENGEDFPRPPSDPSASHNSLQLSLSNPVAAKGSLRCHSSMSQSSLANPTGRSMAHGGVGFSRSSASMGRYVSQNNRHASKKMQKGRSIPAGMDQFTDV